GVLAAALRLRRGADRVLGGDADFAAEDAAGGLDSLLRLRRGIPDGRAQHNFDGPGRRGAARSVSPRLEARHSGRGGIRGRNAGGGCHRAAGARRRRVSITRRGVAAAHPGGGLSASPQRYGTHVTPTKTAAIWSGVSGPPSAISSI